MTYILALIVTLGVLVTVHEFGHYWVARLSGVRILRFAVGFGKPMWSRFDARGTEWAVAAIPLGGYVRMLDERDTDTAGRIQADDVSYNMLHPAWRIAIALGGPVANFLLAIAVYWLLAIAGTTTAVWVLGPMDDASPAARAGLAENMQIQSVDGEATRTWQEVNMALAARLGDTGSIRIGAAFLGGDRAQVYDVPIDNWHRGVDEPDLLGSLGIDPRLPAVVGQVVEGSPAAEAGLQSGDLLLQLADQPLADWSAFQEQISRYPATTVSLLLQRGPEQRQVDVRPEAREVDGEAVGFLGVGPAYNEIRYGVVEAVGEGLAKTGSTVVLTINLLKKMVFGQVSLSNLSGPITIAKVAGDSARVGWKYFLGVLALLSVSLGVLNLLPIPILDGGHVIFASAEWISGKPVSERVMELGYQVGMFLVGGLMILALYNDVARLVSS